MSLKLDLTVAAIAERDGRFLFVQERAARRIVLNQPAGHLEDGESLLDAVIRETREETTRAFQPSAVTGLYLWRGPGGRTVLRIAFSGSVGEPDQDTALDRSIIQALREHDRAALVNLPATALIYGSSEIRNWICAAGAMSHLNYQWHEYIPVRRTPIGSGIGLAFMEWR